MASICYILPLLALLGVVLAATSFTGLPSSIIAPGSQISGSYNTNGDFAEGDWLGLYLQNQTCCPGSCGDCFIQWAYLPSPTGSISFSADSTKSLASANLQIIHIRDQSNGSLSLGTSPVIQVRASATMSPKAPIIAGQAAFVPYTADSTHSTSDWIGLFEVGSPDFVEYTYVSEGPTGTAIVRVPATLVGKQVEFRYIFWYADAVIATTTPFTVQGVLGTCAAECSNAAASCNALGDGSDCLSCTGTEFCVPPPVPQFLDSTITDGSQFVINVGQPWNTTIDVNTTGVTCTNWKFYFDGPARMSASGPLNATRLAWQPLQTESNADYRACFALRCEDTGVSTEQRCFVPFVRSSSCSAWGDPHFSTFDDLSYDYMGIGDYTLMQNKADSSTVVQIRYGLCFPGEYEGPTCATAVALRYVTDQVVMYWQSCVPQLYINSQKMNANQNSTFGGGYFNRLLDLEGVVDQGYEIQIGDFVASVTLTASGAENYCFGNVVVRPTKYMYGGIVGMCGTWDSNPSNDLVFPNGTATSNLDAFGNSWRVSESDSLFNYTLVEFGNYSSVNNFSKTYTYGTPMFDSPELEAAAAQICSSVAADKPSQQACMLDIAASGNLSYARLTAAKSVAECTAATNGQTSDCNPNSKCASLKYCNYHGNCTQAATCVCSSGFSGSMCETAVTLSSASQPMIYWTVLLAMLVVVMAEIF